jgi:aspartyl-tRNA synthetase
MKNKLVIDGKEEFVKDFEQRPGEVIGDLWDLVLNGWELASGSIRVSNPETIFDSKNIFDVE